MQTFEKSILMIALFVLIVALLAVGTSLKTTSNQKDLTRSECPDYWVSSYTQPCSLSTYGCCDDGFTTSNSTGSNCKACEDTTYGCCPDGMTAKTSGTDDCKPSGSSKCWNVFKLGLGSTACNTALSSAFDGSNGVSRLCKKQQYANTCKLAWDGVTNVDSDCR